VTRISTGAVHVAKLKIALEGPQCVLDFEQFIQCTKLYSAGNITLWLKGEVLKYQVIDLSS
jgi:hypothetical protein